MSINYGFGFSIFLLVFFFINLYFFYSLNKHNVILESKSNAVDHKLVISNGKSQIHHDILEYLNYLPLKYKSSHIGFQTVRQNLISYFNLSATNGINNVWSSIKMWNEKSSLYPLRNGTAGQIIAAIKRNKIIGAYNAMKGTQLKLFFVLENGYKLIFKPKRYEIDHFLNGPIYGGYDRHNSEVLGYYLAMVMNSTWVAPSTIRKLHVNKEILPVADKGLLETTVRNASGAVCFYGKCLYCKINETACPNNKDELEGAAILYLDKKFKKFAHPWRRSYKSKKMEWEINESFCKKVQLTLSTKRLLNLIDVAIFDFLIQNGDRHHYEVFEQKIILLDNGKGLGNPYIDELDILAPLYQCCMIDTNTWSHLEKLSGGSLTSTIKLLSSIHGDVITTEDHYKALERRLLIIYATVHYCIGKHGSAKVFKINN